MRVRDGKASVTDGPFAETKEQLAGFYLIDARDLDEAIRVAADIPPARAGAASIEVRPVRQLDPGSGTDAMTQENAMSTNSAPGFEKRPDHSIVTQPAGVRVRVEFNGAVMADSRDALVMKEGDYPPVFYFPRRDVAMARLRALERTRPTARSRAPPRTSRCAAARRTRSGPTRRLTTR